MQKITNAVLLEKINNIKEDTAEIKKDYKENSTNQWKQINKNAQSIASQRAVNGVIAFVVSIGTTLLATYFGVKHQ